MGLLIKSESREVRETEPQSSTQAKQRLFSQEIPAVWPFFLSHIKRYLSTDI